MIPIIDARSGRRVQPGETVYYPDGSWWRLVTVGIPSLSEVSVDIATRDHYMSVRCPVHYFTRHGWRVAIYPS